MKTLMIVPKFNPEEYFMLNKYDINITNNNITIDGILFNDHPDKNELQSYIICDCYFYIMCPICKDKVYCTGNGNVETDDYVKSNCLLWCDNCREILFCISNDNYSLSNIILDNISDSDCTKKITHKNANILFPYLSKINEFCKEEYDEDTDTDTKAEADEYNLFVVSSIEINALGHLPCDCDESDTLEETLSNVEYVNFNTPIKCFKDVPKNIDSHHDGTILYYKAKCTECNKCYKSFIWGD